MPTLPDNLRKAAVLVSTLDASSADALLDQIPGEQAARIRNALMSLEAIDATEQERVVFEFLGQRAERSMLLDGGVELDQRLLSRATARPVRESRDRPRDPVPFQFLHEAEADDLGRLLGREHPQIAAVVMSHLPPRKAADILATLPSGMQTAVLRRIADLEAADPDVIRDLEKELQVRLAGHLDGVRSSGVKAVWEILQAADGGDRREWLHHIDANDRELASRIAKRSAEKQGGDVAERAVDGRAAKPAPTAEPSADRSRETDRGSPTAAPTPHPIPVVPEPSDEPDTASTLERTPAVEFADLDQLDDKELIRVLRGSDPRCLTLALAGAEPAFAGRVLALLPAREARGIRRNMLRMKPLLLSDVDAAQRGMAEVAAQLVEQGVIGELPIRRFAAAA